LNRPKEIFTQLSAVAPKANLKLKDFGERYCQGNRFDKYGGAKNLDELFALLHSSVMVRRLMNDVLSELPRKRRQKVFLGLDAAGKKQLGKLKEQMEENRAALVSSILSGRGGALHGNGVIMEVYKKTADIKIKAVQEYVGQLIETGEKFLIFAHHIALLDAIEHACNRGGGSSGGANGKNSKKKANYIRIDGSTPAQHRGSMVESFQNDPSIQVAILSIKAAGVGLTLTAASTVVFSELTWVPGDLIQAEDRAHRIGQRKSVNVSFLLVRGSIDEVGVGVFVTRTSVRARSLSASPAISLSLSLSLSLARSLTCATRSLVRRAGHLEHHRAKAGEPRRVPQRGRAEDERDAHRAAGRQPAQHSELLQPEYPKE